MQNMTKPLSFRELAQQRFRSTWSQDWIEARRQERKRVGPEYLGFFNYDPFEEGVYEPFLGASFEPFVLLGRGHFIYILYPVNRGRMEVGVASVHDKKPFEKHRTPRFFPFTRFFEVYDMDLERLDDPAFIEDLTKIEAENILVAKDWEEAASIGSWVVDKNIRGRINEYFEANQERERWKQVEKYTTLRQAPFATYGYTYQRVKEEATRQFRGEWDPNIGETVEAPVTFRMFTEDDVDWLETFMINKGIPIPEV